MSEAFAADYYPIPPEGPNDPFDWTDVGVVLGILLIALILVQAVPRL